MVEQSGKIQLATPDRIEWLDRVDRLVRYCWPTSDVPPRLRSTLHL